MRQSGLPARIADMDPVIVVGGGISGMSCARVIASAGLSVTVLDRGRGVGGRMAAPVLDGRPVDTGASYFTVSDDAFAAVVDDWEQRGLARRWTDTFDVFDADTPGERKTGNDRWAAGRGLASLVEDLARGLDVERHTVESVAATGERGHIMVDGRPASAVVLAMPDPQARSLLDANSSVWSALDDPFEPVLALSAGWDARTWGSLAGETAFAGAFDGAFVNGDEHLSWIADDGRRRGDDAAVLVAHSTPTLAAAHLKAPDEAQTPMLKALMSLLGISESPRWTHLHRWSVAKPTGAREQPFYLDDTTIGVCGDAWSQRPRVESAYLSGAALGAALVAQLTT